MNRRILRNYDLNLLVLFDALMEELHVSRAAEKVFLSQSAMSHALNRLRTLLDDNILVKTEYGMAPTPVASKLRDPIRDTLNRIEQALLETKVFDPTASQAEFVITCTEYFECLFYPTLMTQMEESSPNISVILDILGHELPMERLSTGEIHFVLGNNQMVNPSKGLVSTPWVKDTLVCIARKGNKKIGDKLTLEEFTEIPQLYYIMFDTPGSFTFADLWVQKNSYEVNYKSGTSVYLTAARTISRTDYIMTLPRKLAQVLVTYEDLKILELPGKVPQFQLDLIWHKIYEDDPAHKWMRERLLELAKMRV